MIIAIWILLGLLLAACLAIKNYRDEARYFESQHSASRLSARGWYEAYSEASDRADRARAERDCYLTGLGIISNMKTENMAHIGKRMAAAADYALERGIDV